MDSYSGWDPDIRYVEEKISNSIKDTSLSQVRLIVISLIWASIIFSS